MLTVEAVLNGSPIVCAGCGLELKTKPGTSQAALDALGRWHEETRDAREQAAPAAGSAAVPRPRHARRARGRRPRR